MLTSIAGKTANNQFGFSYLLVLVAIVIIGILVEVAHVTTWRVLKVDREAELLYRGRAYRRAIESYYNTNGRFPRSLGDLIKDPNWASRHHLRALYTDPMAVGEKKDWVLVYSQSGGISGVASSSTEKPFKQTNFPKDLEKFNGAKSYKDWLFEFSPKTVARQPSPSFGRTPATPPVLKTY